MRVRIIGTLLTASLAAGCGGDSDDTPGDTSTADATGDVGGDDAGVDAVGTDTGTDTPGDDTGPAPVDTGLDTPGPESCEDLGGRLVQQVRGTIVDESGTPIEGAKAQVCIRGAGGGALVCLRPGDTDAQGGFDIGVPQINQCMDEMTLRSLVPSQPYATTYCHVPLEGAQTTMDLTGSPFVLFGTTPPTTLPDRGDGTQTVTVVFADGLEVDVRPEALSGVASEYDRMSASRVDPTSDGLCFLSVDNVPDRLYAFLPEVDILNDAFDVRIPNDDGLAAGTEVELWVLGGLATTIQGGGSVREAEWEPYGTGTVDADGAFIAAPAGFHTFNWFGYRVTE